MRCGGGQPGWSSLLLLLALSVLLLLSGAAHPALPLVGAVALGAVAWRYSRHAAVYLVVWGLLMTIGILGVRAGAPGPIGPLPSDGEVAP